jgi:hypothetical protein
MSSKRIEILKKASNHFEKASHSQKQPRDNCRIATIASPPLFINANKRFL